MKERRAQGCFAERTGALSSLSHFMFALPIYHHTVAELIIPKSTQAALFIHQERSP